MRFVKGFAGVILIVILIGIILVLSALLLKPVAESHNFYIEVRWDNSVWSWPTKPVSLTPTVVGWQDRGDYHIFYPTTTGSHKNVMVWLSGGGEKNDKVLSSGLPTMAATLDDILIVPVKTTNNWDTSKTVDIINSALSEIEINGYEVKTLQGFGFSAGGQGLTRVAVRQELRQQFDVVNILGIAINNKTVRQDLADALNAGQVGQVNLLVGDKDKSDRVKGARADGQWLTNHCPGKVVNYTVIDDCGHNADKLSQRALGR